MASETWTRWRYKYVPDQIVGEILAKNWIDTLIPVVFLAAAFIFFSIQMPGFLGGSNLSDIAQIYGEYLIIIVGITFVMMAGGIDLTVGSVFAFCNLAALMLINTMEVNLAIGIPAIILLGGMIGLINGLLIGYLGMRAFLTTLVMLIIVRAIVDQGLLDYGQTLMGGFNASAGWEFMAIGRVFGIPSSLFVAAFIALAGHIVLTRMRFGWHVMAVGGSRRSAFNAGIKVKRTICITYVLSGMLAGLAATFYAARLSSAGTDVGKGLEVTMLTAAVLGGISLGGGRGSIVKAMLGAIIILLVQNSLIRMGLTSGASSLILGGMLLLAVAIDVRWLKNRHKVLARAYVSPTYFKLPPLPETASDSGSVYALNDRLRGVEAIGLGELDGPEDVIFDRDDNLYCGSRHGDVIRFFAPDHTRSEVFAHIGGHPLGFAFDAEGNLHTCVGGMGLYKVTPEREVIKLSDETNRTLLSIVDDLRLRLADDLDIAPDGRVFFSEATVRYEMYDWMVDALEGRGNGRIICYDPKDRSSRTVLPNLQLPNGICVEPGGQSLLYAETWGCRITRWYFDGPKKGQSEVVIDNLPGYPDNINRASDGTFWCALCGMRSPVFDLALRMPKFRRRMVYKVGRDDWLYPNMNTGCVIKFDAAGNVLDVLWDLGGEAHPMITSIREHKGYLYLGGIYNNRVGKYKIPYADPAWTSFENYWGEKVVIGAARRAWENFRGGGEAAVTVPPMDGALRPNRRLEQAPVAIAAQAPADITTDGNQVLYASGASVMRLDRVRGLAETVRSFDSPVTALALSAAGTTAVGLDDGRVVFVGGAHDGLAITQLGSRESACPTALTFASETELLVAQGSATRRPSEWKHDVMLRGATGSVWRVTPGSEAKLLADRLSWPLGLALAEGGAIAVSESWKHRVLLIGADGATSVTLEDLPGYPARLSSASDGGYWLAIFAPRNQIIEFVQREPEFLRRMMVEIEPAYWAAPSLKPSNTFLEPLQGGAQKHLGILKPWAPTRSYGLVAHLDRNFRPTHSYHSRADGLRHGVMACAEVDGALLVACTGGDVIAAIDVNRTGAA